MNGTLPDFLADKPLWKGYFDKADPYTVAPSCNVDLLKLSRYAKTAKKPLAKLTSDEVARFAI
jgi:hypothetical protein